MSFESRRSSQRHLPTRREELTHDVRADRVPGETDALKDALARVYDGKMTVITYLLPTGDPQKPDKSAPMAPGVPEFLGNDWFHVDAVKLPPRGYYPGLNPVLQQEELGQQRRQVQQAKDRIAKLRNMQLDLAAQLANREIEKDGSKPNDAVRRKLIVQKQTHDAALKLAEKQLGAAKALLTSVEVRISADQARFGRAPADQTRTLTTAALKAEKQADYCTAEVNLLQAEQQLTALSEQRNAQTAKAKKAMADAKKKMQTARKAMQRATAAVKTLHGKYSSFGPIYP